MNILLDPYFNDVCKEKIHSIQPTVSTNSKHSYLYFANIQNKVKSSKGVSNSKLNNPIEKIKGRLIDEKNQAIPYCNIVIKGSIIGTISNRNGFFEIKFSKNLKVDTLIFSCVGYERREVAVSDLLETTMLISKEVILDEIKIEAKSLDPVSILKKAIDNIPQNYIQQDYNAEIYSRGILTNYDSLVVDVENVVKIYDKNGFDNNENITRNSIAFRKNKFYRCISSSPKAVAYSPFFLQKVDMVSISPLFKKKNLKKYCFKLLGTTEYNDEKVYKIGFNSKSTAYRYTLAYYIKKFSGTIYVNSIDYSIVKTAVCWEYNLDKIKGINDFYPEVEYIKSSAAYKKHNSKYFFNYGNYTRILEGKNSRTKNDYKLKGEQTIFTTKIELKDVEIIPEKQSISLKSKKLKKDDAFWDNYNKPVK
ncbi:MAG: carboxypeptidase-like regulatory domain-containing protein [Nitrososphaeraceae archaeon]